MTREEAIHTFQHLRLTLSNRDPVEHFFSPRRIEAIDLAIEALRGEKCQYETCRKLKGATGAVRLVMDDFRAYRAEAEEALKALEREPRRCNDICGNIRDPLAWQTIKNLHADLQAEREKVEKLRRWLLSDPIEAGDAHLIVLIEIDKLFPDHAPEPELHDWAWALEELKAGRKVRWETWPQNTYMVMHKIKRLRVYYGNIISDFGPTDLVVFTEPGWLPFKE